VTDSTAGTPDPQTLTAVSPLRRPSSFCLLPHGAAVRDPRYGARFQRTKRRLGKQRGSKVARVELARELASAIWYMLTRQEPFRAGGPSCGLVA
jgi:hypothetical protein